MIFLDEYNAQVSKNKSKTLQTIKTMTKRKFQRKPKKTANKKAKAVKSMLTRTSFPAQ